MDTHALESLVEDRLRTMGVICAALVGSVFVYSAVAWLVLEQGQLVPSDALTQVPVLPYLLAGVGLAALALAPVVSRMVLKQGGKLPEQSEPEHLLARYQSSTIVGFAVRESAAVIGLVATFLTGSLTWVAVLGAAAVLAMVAAWPRKAAALSLLQTGSPPIG